MKRALFIILLFVFVSVVYAQAGNEYKGTTRVYEKSYEVSQKHGKNVLKLKTRSIGYYNNDGEVYHKVIYKGNMTFWGKQNKNYNPDVIETLNYNYMNLLSSRSVVIKSENEGEYTEIEYDTKGKIVTKTNNRIFNTSGALWQVEYSQLGYPNHFLELIEEDSKVVAKNKYDYFNELVERHYMVYNDEDKLVQTYVLGLQDTLVYRVEYEYNPEGRIIEEKYFDHNDYFYESVRYFYDDKGRIIQLNKFVWDLRFGEIPKLRQQNDYEYF